jgi:hypothetical protein
MQTDKKMNRAETIENLRKEGWMSFMPDNELGWKFFFRRDKGGEYHAFFGPAWEYLTLFPNNHMAEGIIETRYQREKRKLRGILFRDFRGLKL